MLCDERQIAAWDANLVTPHKRMGNSEVDLDCICDGELWFTRLLHNFWVTFKHLGEIGLFLLGILLFNTNPKFSSRTLYTSK